MSENVKKGPVINKKAITLIAIILGAIVSLLVIIERATAQERFNVEIQKDVEKCRETTEIHFEYIKDKLEGMEDRDIRIEEKLDRYIERDK